MPSEGRLTKIAILGDEVHLAQDVDVWEFQLEHGPEREEEDRDVFGSVGNIMSVGQVDGYYLRRRTRGDETGRECTAAKVGMVYGARSRLTR